MPETDTSQEPDSQDSLAEYKELFAEQRERQSMLRHVQQFLKSPLFVDLREATSEVSDPPEVIEERRRELDHRIRVLESLVTLLKEEREMLDRTVSVVAADHATPPSPKA